MGAGQHVISLFDLTGKLVKQTIAGGNAGIDLEGLHKGLYIIQVDGSKTARLIIE